MKHILLFTILLFCVSLNAQIINVPDYEFKSYLLGNTAINTNGNSEIEFSEATSYSGTLDLNALQIEDLTGIEYFVEATGLDASQNWIEVTPDLSLLSKLEYLDFNGNELTALTLGNHPHLKIFNLGGNPDFIGTLDVTGCTAMTQFISRNAEPAGLDFSMSPQLDTLILNYHDSVGNLDLSNNTQLTYIELDNSSISSMTLGTHPDLEIIRLSTTNLSTLSTLDVSGCPGLKILQSDHYSSSAITISDLSNNPLLEELRLSNVTNSTNINLNNHSQLNFISIGNADLSHLDFSLLPALKIVRMGNVNVAGNLDITSNSLLEELVVLNDNLTAIDLSGCPLLTAIRLDDNSLTSLDVSSNLSLVSLQLDDNNLTELDVSNNIYLQYLIANNNNLTCVELHATPAYIIYVHLNNNQLTRLDLSNTAAFEILVANNQLSFLDIGNGYNNNGMLNFDATGNPSACINTDDVTYSTFYHGDFKDASASYSASCTDPGACTIITCAAPINQAVEMTTATTALFTWDAVPNASFYQVKYRLKGTTAWSTVGSSNPQRTISNLTAKKYYQYKVRAECSAGDWSDFTSVELFYTSACDAPTGVASIYLDNTRMRIRWDNNPSEIKAKVRYREVGTSTWYTQNSGAGNNYIYINNLTPNATYQYKVRSNCSGNDWSAYSGLYTHDLSSSMRLAQEKMATKIYPNPASDVLNIEFQTQDAEDISITITNSLGKMIQTINNNYDAGIQRESININELAKGYYFITIRSENRIETQKFLRIE